MNLLDRTLIRGYLKAYLVCLVSLLSLYIVVDLFTNAEDFFEHTHGLANILRHVGSYYAYRSSQIFDRLSEAIVLMAAMFTVAMMQRNNELLPLLSAGVPTHRVVRPVLFTAAAMFGFMILNQEVVIPRIGSQLLSNRDDPRGDKDIEAHGAFEPNGIHIAGERASRHEAVVKKFCCLIPETLARNSVHLEAKEAYYYPPGSGPRSGGWLMTGTKPAELADWNNFQVLEVVDSGKYFLHTHEVTFETITRPRNWFFYASTVQLLRELGKPDSTRLASMAVLFHMRLTRPILGMVLVVMGLSVILRDQNRNVFISAGMCLVICAVFFTVSLVCKHFGDNEYLAPALAAWLPVIAFGPLAFAQFDAIHT
ncbi:MAG TPA: LptF/LptG family permease [Gemmataceae bacterium]|jgi:lipopolysaccharide export system permease protein|nr:LptF/LptG family permease [Gemmataceae bacterium]